MPSPAVQTPFASAAPAFLRAPGLLRDAWGRPIFRPPLLPNPRVVFDPLPFRTQLFTAARRAHRFVRS